MKEGGRMAGTVFGASSHLDGGWEDGVGSVSETERGRLNKTGRDRERRCSSQPG